MEAERAGASTFCADSCAVCNGRKCALGRLKSLRDFEADKLEQSTLWQMTEAAGFKLFFLPKFHCELSAIERCWAVLKYWVRRFHDYTLESLRACIKLAVKQYCGTDVIRRAYNTTFRFYYMYSVQKATTAEALGQEKARGPAAKALRRARERVDGGGTHYLQCLVRYQDHMRKHYLSHRRPAKSLEGIAEDAVPDSLLQEYRKHGANW